MIYRLKYSTESKFGETFPQISEVEKPYNFDSEKSIYRLGENNAYSVTGEIDYPVFIRIDSGQPSDFISHAFGSFLIISEQAKSLISKLSLDDFRLDPIRIQWLGRQLENYSVLQIQPFVYPYLNIEKSIFTLDYPLEDRKELIGFQDLDQLVNFQTPDDQDCALGCDEIHLLNPLPHDVICMAPFHGGYYFSQKARGLFIEYGLTGIEFEVPEKPIILMD